MRRLEEGESTNLSELSLTQETGQMEKENLLQSPNFSSQIPVDSDSEAEYLESPAKRARSDPLVDVNNPDNGSIVAILTTLVSTVSSMVGFTSNFQRFFFQNQSKLVYGLFRMAT